MQEQYQLDHSLDEYIANMVSYGVIVNPKLQPALFTLKNGLEYPGLLTKEAVHGEEDLVKIPVDLLLTAFKAMKEPELLSVFENKFYREGATWQDNRVLVTFLLYLLSVNKASIWTDMARQFSKSIDILSFWPSSQFTSFIDKSVLKAATKQKSHFQSEWASFQAMQQDYPVLQNQQWFNRQNYKWIYIHTISRCFGSFLNSTYFVPFCELFNHHSVDVSYTCVDQHKIDAQALKAVNKEEEVTLKQANSKQQPEQNTEQTQLQSSEESVSSGYSEDYLSDDDFDYMSINSYCIKWNSKISYDLKQKQIKTIQTQLQQLYTWIDHQLEWKGFTLLYLGQMIQKLKIYENQYKAGRQKFQQVTEKIEETRLRMNAYRKYLVEFYASLGREYQKVKQERGVQTQGEPTAREVKNREDSKETYTHFKMEARCKADFSARSQIYFSYGKLSNRILLLRYGFSLEDNPYDHVWVKFNLGKHIEPYPDLFEIVQSKGLSVNYKVKLKAYSFAIEPIVYFRVCNWKVTHHSLEDIFFITDLDRELSCLEKVREVYSVYLQKYDSLDLNLSDPSLSYHSYFAAVYNLSQKKILALQLQLTDYVISLLGQIKARQISHKQVQVKPEFARLLKHYLKGLRGIIKV